MHQGDGAPAIEIRDLRKVYGDKAAVDGLTLTVPQGCFFGFLGPNGAGKTTTVKMLMGLAPPTSGSIQLLGLPMPEHSLEIKQQIGLVPDGPQQNAFHAGQLLIRREQGTGFKVKETVAASRKVVYHPGDFGTKVHRPLAA